MFRDRIIELSALATGVGSHIGYDVGMINYDIRNYIITICLLTIIYLGYRLFMSTTE